MDLIHLAQDRDQWRSGSITCSEFRDKLSNMRFSRKIVLCLVLPCEFNLNRPALEVHLRVYFLGNYATLVFCGVMVNELRCIWEKVVVACSLYGREKQENHERQLYWTGI